MSNKAVNILCGFFPGIKGPIPDPGLFFPDSGSVKCAYGSGVMVVSSSGYFH